MGFAIFSSRALRRAREQEPYHGDQALGRQIGHMDIMCTLNSRESSWTESTEGDITGLLCFNIRYKDDGGVPLRSASVQIDVGTPINESPIPVFEAWAPSPGITGASVKQHIVDNRTRNPQLELSTPYGGVSCSGLSHEVSKEFDNEHRWSFEAVNCHNNIDTLVTRARFDWARTSLDDSTGLNRSYKGALVLTCEKNQKVTLKVTVEAQPWKRRYLVRHPAPQYSQPIQPRVFKRPGDFKDLKTDLQGQIIERNLELAAIGKF